MTPRDDASWTVRPGLPTDAARLTRLARDAKAHWGYPATWLQEWARQLVIAAEYISRHRVLVAEMDGDVVAMCALEDHGDHWMLEHVWVDPACHRRGIGRDLVRRALATARALRSDTVRLVSDPGARGFYETLGANFTGEEPAPMPGAPSRTLPRFEFRLTSPPRRTV